MKKDELKYLKNNDSMPKIKKKEKISLLTWNIANTNKGHDFIVKKGIPRPNKRREPEMKGQIVKDEQEATTRRLIHALPMSDVII